jgi:hypothetical protein
LRRTAQFLSAQALTDYGEQPARGVPERQVEAAMTGPPTTMRRASNCRSAETTASMIDHNDSFAFDIERRGSDFRPRAVPLRFDLKIMFSFWP